MSCLDQRFSAFAQFGVSSPRHVTSRNSESKVILENTLCTRFLIRHPTIRLVNNKFSYCMFLESGIQHTDLNIKFQLCAQYLQHILLLRKYHLWGIVRKHKCCSCIVYSPHPPTSIFSQSVSHNPNTSQSNFAFKSSGLTQKGTVLPHTSSGKRENQKDSESRLTMQRGENSFCHCCHSE